MVLLRHIIVIVGGAFSQIASVPPPYSEIGHCTRGREEGIK
jgi:hypothetical protein